MDPLQLALVALSVGVIAFLYSCVGHAGASGYIAVMALFGFAANVVKPTALVLNILVASIATFQFWRAGHFSWPLFWPFAVLSIPMAFVGGYMSGSPVVFRCLVGGVLLLSAARLFFHQKEPAVVTPPPRATALGVGAGIGLLSGLTGTGGGIFLTPLLLFRNWAHTRPVAAISALFILVNSIAGLIGFVSSGKSIRQLRGCCRSPQSLVELLVRISAANGSRCGQFI